MKEKISRQRRRRGRFYNPHFNMSRPIKNLVRWAMGYMRDPNEVVNSPKGYGELECKAKASLHRPTAAWAGHSSFVIRISGITFLTDPIWSLRCSPFQSIGPKRRHPAPFALEDLESVNFVIISHNHYDHLDRETVLQLAKLYPSICWILPERLGRWFHKLGIYNTLEFSWWESRTVECGGKEFSITAVPAQHNSGRTLFDYNKSHWAGFVVEEKTQCFYFVGDTGYNDHDFKAIGKRFQKIDLSLIPIGAYAPRQFLKAIHVDPYQAVKIHQEVGSRLSVACHWNTFRLSEEDRLRPIYELERAKKKLGVESNAFRAINPGSSLNW